MKAGVLTLQGALTILAVLAYAATLVRPAVELSRLLWLAKLIEIGLPGSLIINAACLGIATASARSRGPVDRETSPLYGGLLGLLSAFVGVNFLTGASPFSVWSYSQDGDNWRAGRFGTYEVISSVQLVPIAWNTIRFVLSLHILVFVTGLLFVRSIRAVAARADQHRP